MDEQPIQLLKETRTPIAGTKGHPRRVDYEYEYERAGTASIFIVLRAVGGLASSHGAKAAERRWIGLKRWRAYCELATSRQRKVILVCDNLNTHTKGAFYEHSRRRRRETLVRQLEFCHTPKHGSWLNIAENELSAMTRQCVTGRRFATVEEISSQTTAWHEHSNARQRSVDWQFQVDHARVKLKSIYPKLEV